MESSTADLLRVSIAKAVTDPIQWYRLVAVYKETHPKWKSEHPARLNGSVGNLATLPPYIINAIHDGGIPSSIVNALNSYLLMEFGH